LKHSDITPPVGSSLHQPVLSNESIRRTLVGACRLIGGQITAEQQIGLPTLNGIHIVTREGQLWIREDRY
jgi:hypothetical protein